VIRAQAAGGCAERSKRVRRPESIYDRSGADRCGGSRDTDTYREATLGRIVVSSAVSVDGYAEGAGGDISALPLDQSFNEHNAEQVRRASSLLYGARAYRSMVGYWPGQVDNPDPAERYIARRCADGIPIMVVSDTLTDEDTGPWREQTTIVPRAQSHRSVAALRREEGDAVVFGSRTLWTDLLANGLVDELHLLIGPRIVAGDSRILTGVPVTDLRLIDVQRRDGSDNVLLSYAVAR
jgi:dihydrofolate reductase